MIQSFWQKYKKSMLIPSVLLISVLCYFYFSNETSSTPQEELFEPIQPIEQQNETTLIETAVSKQVFVDIKGAVKSPGVYQLRDDQRVIDAVQLAGGYEDNADTKFINHAQKVQDEMVIYVPVEGEQAIEQASFPVQSSASIIQDGKVNLNQADEETLTTLTGIGPAKAKSIIAYREENGGFGQIEDLKKVSGIGEKTYEKLKDAITVK
ncbi:helix-hairpin-helix domain-containing protein [Lysinibacillus piscis]|uniref:Competence protein ComEA n=1 Tax=Lysinibacillus piscis TaxID=2518931 RepID=A0ABQ5NJU1_9BACI|nr:helix-hairpin-helix domain-containing protein [Lysinibacillus sp. KH24]GLC88535.1 competence protein ComEA [Lysinibacillus sp. KH24]